MSARLVSDHWTVWVGPGPCPRTGHRLTAVALGNPWQDDGPAGLRRYVYELTASEHRRRNVVALLSGQRVGASCPALGSLLVDVANGVPPAAGLSWLGGERFLRRAVRPSGRKDTRRVHVLCAVVGAQLLREAVTRG